GPSYGWGWGWGPTMTWGRPYYANYRPWGLQANRPGGNWASNTRPGGNAGRPVGNRPGYAGANSTNKTQPIRDYHRTYSFDGNRNSTKGSGIGTSSSNRGSYTVGNDGHRRYGTSSGSSSYNSSSSSTSNHRSSSSYNSSSSNRSSSSSSSSYSRGGSYGGSRSSGGSYGGGRSSGGSGHGRRR
ncbi:MAG: hypothetical protein K2J87_02460, partial [Muribaculaceae bacterium]|nr:hypothetical protein [Muribaculaceae bacterium]